ncbi:hypothetical protein B0H17DRAFT_914469, partial [Mycena rosella]
MLPLENAPDISESRTNSANLVTSTHLEDLWEKVYDDRRESAKKNAFSDGCTSNTTERPIVSEDSTSLINEGSAFRDAFSFSNETAQIRQDIQGDAPVQNVDIEAHIRKWTLNHEQAHAFRIIARHSLENHPEQLRMLLSGPGGTGKSRVIHALRDFFDLHGESRRLRFSAYTGVAARNINGMTIHGALCINQRSSQSSQSRTRRDLTAMWEGVDYFFIDEVSMVGCSLLLQIHEAL